MTILIADVHGFLDSGKAPLDLVEDRAAYYEQIIPAIFESIGIDTSRLRTVRGSSYQKQGNFFLDVLRMSSLVTAKKAKKAGAEVVKQDEDSLVSASLYPLMQALDEEYLGVDAQFGGRCCWWGCGVDCADANYTKEWTRGSCSWPLRSGCQSWATRRWVIGCSSQHLPEEHR